MLIHDKVLVQGGVEAHVTPHAIAEALRWFVAYEREERDRQRERRGGESRENRERTETLLKAFEPTWKCVVFSCSVGGLTDTNKRFAHLHIILNNTHTTYMQPKRTHTLDHSIDIHITVKVTHRLP